jgi:hypothetical protein
LLGTPQTPVSEIPSVNVISLQVGAEITSDYQSSKYTQEFHTSTTKIFEDVTGDVTAVADVHVCDITDDITGDRKRKNNNNVSDPDRTISAKNVRHDG